MKFILIVFALTLVGCGVKQGPTKFNVGDKVVGKVDGISIEGKVTRVHVWDDWDGMEGRAEIELKNGQKVIIPDPYLEKSK